MIDKLRKKILAFVIMGMMSTMPLSAFEDHNLTDKQLHAFMGIITNFILSSDSVVVDVPTLTAIPQNNTEEDNISVEVLASAGNTVYVNGTEVGVVDENGTLEVTLPLMHGDNSIYITVKDSNGNESEALVIHIYANVPPVANNSTLTVAEDSVGDINVTLNDIDTDGDTLMVTSVTQGLHGSTSINSDGTIHYMPMLNFNGIDSFEYNISDGHGGDDIATVNVTVEAVNDAPVAYDQNITLAEDTIGYEIVLEGTDIDGDNLTFLSSLPGNVSLSIDGNIATLVLPANYNGTDMLAYVVSDGTTNSMDGLLHITVTPVNDAPTGVNDSITAAEDAAVTINVLENDSDIENDTLSISNLTAPSNGTVGIVSNQVQYIPNANWNGTDTFSYTPNDGTADGNVVTVAMTVNAVNDVPLSDDQNITLDENTIDNIIPLSGSDIDGDTLTYAIDTQPTHGTVTLDGNMAKYTPTTDYFGADSFTFTVNDSHVDSISSSINITVTNLLDPAILEDQTAQLYTKATPINTLSFVNTGGAVVSCSVSPALPEGLTVTVNSDTCEITGVPRVATAITTYTITGTNSEGDDNATVTITVHPDLLINEISSAYYTNSERWFEIYNPSDESINISSYTLKSRYYDGTNDGIFEFSFPSKIIPAKGYLIVKSNHGPAFNTTLADVENDEILYLKDFDSDKFPYWYSDSNGFLELIKDGHTVDFVTFGDNYTPTSATAWTGEYVPKFTLTSSESYMTIARDINSSDSNVLDDWTVREFTTYAAKNDVTCTDDEDKDGIPDCSEVSGSSYAGIDLYAFGARVNQKDIFIEVDYMDSTNDGALSVDEGMIPKQEALDKVEESFAADGYAVHFDVGDLYAQDGNSLNPTKMDLGGGNEVSYSQAVNLGCTDAGVNVHAYKKDNMKTARSNIFYYMLFGSSQNTDGSAGSSGCAENPGNDSLMTFAGWNLKTDTVAHTNTLINFQAGTVMHEFGHNLGLMHGGDENKNYKPNYISVMNYLYQLDGLPTIGDNEGDRYYENKGGTCPNDALTNPYYGEPRNFIMSYSHGTSNNLDEVNGFDESNGLGRAGSNPIDYNCNGAEDDTLTNFDINGDSTNDVVADHNDWAVLNLVYARSSNNAGISSTKSKVKKITINPLVNDIQTVAEETMHRPN